MMRRVSRFGRSRFISTKGANLSKKSVNHNPARTEHTSAHCREYARRRRGTRRCRPSRPEPETHVPSRRQRSCDRADGLAQLLVGKIKRDDQMPAGRVDEWQKRALLAAADIEHDLAGTTIYQFRGLILVELLYVALNPGRAGRSSAALLSRRLAAMKTREQGTRLLP
jgi:hypothetical protein